VALLKSALFYDQHKNGEIFTLTLIPKVIFYSMRVLVLLLLRHDE